MKKPDPKIKLLIEKLLIQSIKGNPQGRWLDDLVRAVGYINPKAVRGGELADLYGISPMGVSQWHKRDGLRRNRRDKTYNLEAVIKWREKRLGTQSESSESDLDKAERLLKWEKVKLAILERELREGRLCELEPVRIWLERIASRLRQVGDTLQRKFGDEAQQVLNEAIEDISNDVESQITVNKEGSPVVSG